MNADIETLCANTIRGLAMDAIQAANSGHPGAPMGMADIATVLWGQVLEFDPAEPSWPDRDRVVLSNGHASMLLYSVLHLTGTAFTLDDIKDFRQWGSATAGHPEYGHAPGIETTTGPLGQGVSNGVGMALAARWLEARFGRELVDHYVYVLAGDGCMMEGLSSEAASIAGHLGLGRVIVLYDDNGITIDGETDLVFSEDVGARFASMGWHIQTVDGHDQTAILAAIEAARAESDRPSLVSCRTVIAKGSPGKAGSNSSHGAPLGVDEVAATKKALGLDPAASFVVPDEVRDWFRRRNGAIAERRKAWEARLAAHPQRDLWEAFHDEPDLSAIEWPEFEAGTKLATRKASHKVLQAVASVVGNFIGGSADLAGSNGSTIGGSSFISRDDFTGRNLHFGIREHAMAGLCNGVSLHGGVHPYCATFLVFHDYMRPSVRMAALMKRPVIYIYTHDSVFVGEDGPTHQPIEHIQSMRLMPNLWVVRPADASETVEAWKIALARRDGPTALCLTRQGVPVLDRTHLASARGAALGGYVLAEGSGGRPAVALVATGSEVSLALEARDALERDGVAARVVSLPCWDLFLAQDDAYRDSVLPPGLPRVSIEAGVTFAWDRIVGSAGASVGIDRFGSSAPGAEVADRLGMNVASIVEAVRSVLG